MGQIFSFLICLAIILLPFNDLPYSQSLFGELAREGAFYPFLLAIPLLFLCLLAGSRISLPNNLSAKALLAFVLCSCISIVVNMPWIMQSEFKGRYGPEKALLQVILLAFMVITAVVIYSTTKKQGRFLEDVNRAVLFSLVLPCTYSFLEILFFAGIDGPRDILQAIHPYIRDINIRGDDVSAYFGRLRSVSGEASWFAMYISFALPWVLASLLATRKHTWMRLMLFIYLNLLIILTWSRTAYFICVIQLVLFVTLVISKTKFSGIGKRALALPAILLTSAGATGLLFSETIFSEVSILDLVSSVMSSFSDGENLSNIARLGSQAAALDVAAAHPILGTGLGQFGFVAAAHMPDWAFASDEVQMWMNPMAGTPWPPVHALYPRLAAELGYIGLSLWVGLWLALVISCFRTYEANTRSQGGPDLMGLALIISIIGVLLSGLNSDSLRFFGYWILMGLAWSYNHQRRDTQKP